MHLLILGGSRRGGLGGLGGALGLLGGVAQGLVALCSRWHRTRLSSAQALSVGPSIRPENMSLMAQR
jgi:hypothetical protein